MTKSKAELLVKHIGILPASEMTEGQRQCIFSCMEEWGKQCVYLFGQFMLSNDMAYDSFKNPEWGLLSHAQKEEKFFSEFLPSIFK